MARQYGASASGMGVEDLGLMGNPEAPWGIVVIEGGAEMDEYSKAALLSLFGQYPGIRMPSRAGVRH